MLLERNQFDGKKEKLLVKSICEKVNDFCKDCTKILVKIKFKFGVDVDYVQKI